MIRQHRGSAPDMDTMRFIMSVQPEYLERSLEVITERNGGVEGYIRDVLGVDKAKRDAIEKRLFG